MRKLLCPQCKVSSMYVKNGKGERRAVYVTDGGVVVARKEGETLDGFDLETVYCMGCSWSGSPKRMVKMRFVRYESVDEGLFSTLRHYVPPPLYGWRHTGEGFKCLR